METNGQQPSEPVVEKKARKTRVCKNIFGVITGKDADGNTVLLPVDGFPGSITKREKAIAAAKDIQKKLAADEMDVPEIILIRRLATVKAKVEIQTTFSVE